MTVREKEREVGNRRDQGMRGEVRIWEKKEKEK